MGREREKSPTPIDMANIGKKPIVWASVADTYLYGGGCPEHLLVYSDDARKEQSSDPDH